MYRNWQDELVLAQQLEMLSLSLVWNPMFRRSFAQQIAKVSFKLAVVRSAKLLHGQSGVMNKEDAAAKC